MAPWSARLRSLTGRLRRLADETTLNESFMENESGRRNAKPLRCGKCKSSGWDRVHNTEMRRVSVSVTPSDPPAAVEKVSVEIAPETLTDSKLASMLGCSRTAILYARRRAAGLCERCTSPAEDGKAYCLRHSVALARARRKRMGNRPWKPGRPGRPPAR